MKSTGEALGISKDFNEALHKAFLGAGVKLPKYYNMVITVKDEDKEDIIPIAKRFEAVGYNIYSTRGTYNVLKEAGVDCIRTRKVEQESPNILDLVLGHELDIVIDTPRDGASNRRDGFIIRRNAVETGVNVITAIDTAEALITSLENRKKNINLVDIAEI
jgi:carbamoyl-phosphate synthase large subunit